VIIFIASVLGLITGPFLSMQRRFWVPRLTFRLLSIWLRICCNIRFEIQGRENLPKAPCVLVSNHQSDWETYALQSLGLPLCTVLKRELLWIPLFGWALALLRPISIDRGRSVLASRSVMTQGKKRLEKGHAVLLFPEGTRVAPDRKMPFRSSGARLAHAAGVPLVPIVHNAGRFWPGKQLRKKAGVIRLVIGPPIDTADKSSDAVHAQTLEWIEKTRTIL
jgi:1-acyl-sn-glycerol-3-phosphate acyltransferase